MIEQAAAVEGGLFRSTPHTGPRRSLLIHPRINPLVDVANPIVDLITPSSRPSGGSPLRQAQKRIAGRVHSRTDTAEWGSGLPSFIHTLIPIVLP